MNNILACLGKILRYAHEMEVLASVPRIKLLKLPPPKFDFLTFEELERLVEVVRDDSARYALFLVGAEAGLRQGEMTAIEWGDVDFVTRTITVRRSVWRGISDTPKSGRDRKVPMTARLFGAMKAHRHLRSDRVFCHADASAFTQIGVRGGASLRVQAGGASTDRYARPSSHLLLAPRDAGGGAEGDPRVGGAFHAGDDDAVHASRADRASASDRTFGFWAAGGQSREGGFVK